MLFTLIDNNGAVVVEYKYDAWGNHEAEVASEGYVTLANLNPFRYRGYYYDSETDLYFLQTRYYDPVVGRFISRDSIEYADPETICGLNLYAYCGNNPMMNVDPTGTFILSALATLVVVVVLFSTPVGGVAAQVVTSIVSYISMAVVSIWNAEVRADMNAIGWNPFNSNEMAVLNSQFVSFYKGVPVFRTNMDRSGTFYAIFLQRDSVNETILKHEWGHTIQSAILGLVNYGIMIGLPSMLELSDRKYYSRSWEITADIFGGVTERFENGYYGRDDVLRGFVYLGIAKLLGVFGFPIISVYN